MRSVSWALRLNALLLAAFAGAASAWAQQIHRWVDERGRVHYSDTRPPQALEQSVLDKQGRVLRQLTPIGGASTTASRDRPHQLDFARLRQDRALLSTFVHEDEIDLARDRALAQERARQRSLQAMLEQARARLAQIDAELADHEKAGRPVPDTLRQSRRQTEHELARLTEMHERSVAAVAQTQARYEAYKRRFRELKGVAPEPPSNGPAPPAVGSAMP